MQYPHQLAQKSTSTYRLPRYWERLIDFPSVSRRVKSGAGEPTGNCAVAAAALSSTAAAPRAALIHRFIAASSQQKPPLAPTGGRPSRLIAVHTGRKTRFMRR